MGLMKVKIICLYLSAIAVGLLTGFLSTYFQKTIHILSHLMQKFYAYAAFLPVPPVVFSIVKAHFEKSIRNQVTLIGMPEEVWAWNNSILE